MLISHYKQYEQQQAGCFLLHKWIEMSTGMKIFSLSLSKHVTMEDSYLCGYLKIKGLTEVSASSCLFPYQQTEKLLFKNISRHIGPQGLKGHSHVYNLLALQSILLFNYFTFLGGFSGKL